MLMILDKKKSMRILEFMKLYKQNPLEKFFIFTIYQTILQWL